MQAGIQVSSAILFHVSLFNCITTEKAPLQITNMKHIFSAKSLKRKHLPSCGPGYISIISKCFLRISVVFFRVWCCNASLNKDSFWMDITCNLTRHIGLLPIWIELPVFLWHFSFDTHFLLNCYTWLNVTSLLPQYTSSNLTQINYRVYACNKDKK